MSLHSSLKTAGNLNQHRNVLKRHERIERLADSGRFDPKKDDALGLPKVGNRKARHRQEEGRQEGRRINPPALPPLPVPPAAPPGSTQRPETAFSNACPARTQDHNEHARSIRPLRALRFG